MNESQLLNYMKSNRCLAKCGKLDTLQAAKALEERGMIVQVGEYQGSKIYHMTDKAIHMYNPKWLPPVTHDNSVLLEKPQVVAGFHKDVIVS